MDTPTENDIPPATEEYYLRTSDNQEYGPANLDTIRQWCREGRITPDQQLSVDREQWQNVTDLPALEFDWLLVLADGTEAGPFNRAMLEEEWAAGNIPEGAMFKQRHSDAEILPDALSPLPAYPPGAATGDGDETPPAKGTRGSTVPVLPADPDEDPPPPTGSDEEEPLSLRLETLTRRAAEAREQLALSRDNLNTLRMQNTLLEDENLHLQERSATAEAERDAAEQNLLDMQNQAAQNATELDNLRAQLAQMQEHYDVLQLENQRQFEQIDDLRAKALTTEQSWKRELAVLQNQLDAKNRILAEVTGILLQDAPVPASAPRLISTAQPTADTEPPATNPPAARAEAPQRQSAAPAPRPATLARPGVQPAQGQRWIGALAVLLALLLLVLAGAGIVAVLSAWLGRRSESAAPTEGQMPPATASTQRPVSPPVAEALVLPLETTTQRPVAQPAAPPRNWPVLDLPGTTIARDDKTMRITFDYGLFASGTRLQEKARDDLLRLANQLREHITDFTLIAEGHTDAIPVRPGNEQFIDNYSLALARAETVKHFLAAQGGLPAGRIHTASAGPSTPPYPNDTAENRARNRTVVLSVIPAP